jgi:hypothetical protein
VTVVALTQCLRTTFILSTIQIYSNGAYMYMHFSGVCFAA